MLEVADAIANKMAKDVVTVAELPRVESPLRGVLTLCPMILLLSRRTICNGLEKDSFAMWVQGTAT